MDAKTALIAKLDLVLRDDAIIASNTSTLDIDQLARASRNPGRVIGMHYFSPAHVMKLLEIVRGSQSDPETIKRAVHFGDHLGKISVVVGNCFGFVGNRMLFARAAQSERTLLEGATPTQNDAALTNFGFPMGQHEMMDLSGLDVEWRIRKPRGEKRPVSDRLVELKRWGQKKGAGFYSYDAETRGASADPSVEEICRQLGAQLGYEQRQFSETELLERQLYPLVNEGIRILEEGVADSPEDIDTIWRYGYGWPADKVGPIAWAETQGAAHLCARLDSFFRETGDTSLEPALSLRRAAENGTTIAEEAMKGTT
jgi:3-hydroxyacyl-CoA dehydrogenase